MTNDSPEELVRARIEEAERSRAARAKAAAQEAQRLAQQECDRRKRANMAMIAAANRLFGSLTDETWQTRGKLWLVKIHPLRKKLFSLKRATVEMAAIQFVVRFTIKGSYMVNSVWITSNGLICVQLIVKGRNVLVPITDPHVKLETELIEAIPAAFESP